MEENTQKLSLAHYLSKVFNFNSENQMQAPEKQSGTTLCRWSLKCFVVFQVSGSGFYMISLLENEILSP